MDKHKPVSKGISIKTLLATAALTLLVIAFAIYLYVQKDKPLTNREQEPKGPFPYEMEDITFTNANANVTLSGTLTLPSNRNEKYPAVILISGYGPQNRDAEWNGHKPFLIIADCLTRQGFAVLRYDDRGFGKSTGNYHAGTSLDFSTDVESAVHFLKTRKEIDSTRIGLIGHSDGAMIAPMVAARSNDVSFIIMLAGPGKLGGDIMVERQVLLERRMGKSEQEIQRSKEYIEQLISIIVSSENEKDLKSALDKFANETKDQIPDDQIPPGMTKEEFISRQVTMLTSPFFKYFFTYDPQDDLRNVKCPVLALGGEKDVQVPSTDNLQAIKNALVAGGNSDVTVKELKRLNHMFQECSTGMINEYGKIEQTFSPIALAEISQFVLQKSDLKGNEHRGD
ncbi:alpha/beta fold hydrolase [Fulvivirgaceae bacterium PWU5]|uniref:Alpha/beta fold hydrolase n=1 Tax=Dawidia cretensis TaxID=2782350 RepID=A0AAP2DZ49_9BACT|nr:alpha/beta fold hydrolase [Dawidia cretensis]MBT1710046.1 alpha/beta fold hydrolase [Dawidia cretensis]